MREPSGWLISATASIDLTIYAYIYPKELALFMKIKKKKQDLYKGWIRQLGHCG